MEGLIRQARKGRIKTTTMASMLRNSANSTSSIVRRCVTVTKQQQQCRSYHLSLLSSNAAAAAGGHHVPPPMPPFARSPPVFEKITENRDCVWDDGVAPELALDFDVPNMSSSEALWTLMGAFGLFALYYQVIKYTVVENPALGHETDCVYPDYSQPDVIPPPKK